MSSQRATRELLRLHPTTMLAPVALLTTAELARELNVAVRTVQRWVDRGWVKPDVVLPSGHYRFELESVKQQLRERQQRSD